MESHGVNSRCAEAVAVSESSAWEESVVSIIHQILSYILDEVNIKSHMKQSWNSSFATPLNGNWRISQSQ